MKTRAAAWLALLASCLCASAGFAQSGSFIVAVGNDTIAIERFTRTPDRVAGELIGRAPAIHLKYEVFLQNGVASVMNNALLANVPDSSTLESAVLSFRPDSIVVNVDRGGKTWEQRLASRPNAFPFINLSFVLLEPVIAWAQNNKQTTAPLFMIMGGQHLDAEMNFVRPDSLVLSIGAVAVQFKLGANGSILGGFVPTQNVRITRSGGSATLAAARMDYSAPADAPYTAEQVIVTTRDGAQLAGTLTLPKQRPARVPAVVTISGSGLQDRDEALPFLPGYKPFRQIADALARRGVAVLRYDDRGYGASTGNPVDATSADFADDARAVLAALRKRSDIDSTQLFLLGHSEGAIIAPLIAATDTTLRGIVLLAGTSRNGRQVLEYQNRSVIDALPNLSAQQKDSMFTASMLQLDSVATRQAWTRFFLDYDPLSSARMVKAPVLILHGETDRQVTADQAPELAAAFRAGGNRDVTLHVFSDVNHLFLHDKNGAPSAYTALTDRTVVAPALEMITDWVAKHLK